MIYSTIKTLLSTSNLYRREKERFKSLKILLLCMEISKDIAIIDLALYLKKYKTLVISDCHIGFEEALNKQGVLIPRFQFKEIIDRLTEILKKVNPETIIINGDVKHEFGTISKQEWRQTLQLIDFLSKHCKRLILIRGNHDKILGPIADKRKITIADNVLLEDILITHGHKLVKSLKGIKTIIIGHEHPAIGLRDNAKVETYKCFLKGTFERRTLIVMPSFNFITQGTDLSKEKLISPYLKKFIGNFYCFVVEDKIYDFGMLKNLG